MSPISDQDLINFIYAEARMLDEQRFTAWLDLLTDDMHYWMPLAHDQDDPRLHTSLMSEDKLLLRIRVERLGGQRTYSQQPRSRCHHLLARPEIETGHALHQPENGQYVVRTAFHYVESRQDEQTLYAGWATHELVQQDGVLRIRKKRIDLLNREAALGNIQLLM
jgi:3-phenylpropionate/cinnamic acid dioxygenase small subunit